MLHPVLVPLAGTFCTCCKHWLQHFSVGSTPCSAGFCSPRASWQPCPAPVFPCPACLTGYRLSPEELERLLDQLDPGNTGGWTGKWVRLADGQGAGCVSVPLLQVSWLFHCFIQLRHCL